jgi:WhiB family redox-sensing transcriptional regulator
MTDVHGLFGALAGIPRLDGAACRGQAWAFDPVEQSDNGAEVRDLQLAALAVCAVCPALDACRTWFDSLPPRDRPTGVIAGRIRRTREPREQATA